MLYTVVRALLWAYPLCTLIEGLLKMPELHTVELLCQKVCEEGGPCDCYCMCIVDIFEYSFIFQFNE